MPYISLTLGFIKPAPLDRGPVGYATNLPTIGQRLLGFPVLSGLGISGVVLSGSSSFIIPKFELIC